MTLIQKWKPAGAVIVSTPQDLSLMDATRAIDMFRKMDVPVIGLVENMAGYLCPHCGEVSDPFGSGGAEAAARTMSIPFLGRIPLRTAHPPGLRRRHAAGGGRGRGGGDFPRAGRSASRPAEGAPLMPLTRDEDIYELLASTRTIAMIGASDRPDRPSHGVMAYLQSRGYRVIPVNPQITGEHVHGEYVWRELAQIGEPIDLVDIFRRPQAAGEAVDEAIAAGAKAVWLQLGVINEEAAARAEAAGLKVVMNRCPKIEIPRLGVPKVG